MEETKKSKQPLLEAGDSEAHEEAWLDTWGGDADIILADRKNISQDLAQLRALADKVYDDVLKLRTGLPEGQSPDLYLMAVSANNTRFKKRLNRYLLAIEEYGVSLRRKDLRDLDELAVMEEKIDAIIGHHSLDQQRLAGEEPAAPMPAVDKIEARFEAKQKDQQKRADDHIKAEEARGQDSDVKELVDDIKTKVKTDKRERIQSLRRGLMVTELKELGKRILLILALFMIPIFYWTFGRPDPNQKVAVDTRIYQDVFDMKEAYRQRDHFIAVVDENWIFLYPREKNFQMKTLGKRLGPATKRLEVMDVKGRLVAERDSDGEIRYYSPFQEI